MLETFVDPQHYRGSCYKAANWCYLGMTTGLGLVRKGKSYRTSAKKVFAKEPTINNIAIIDLIGAYIIMILRFVKLA